MSQDKQRLAAMYGVAAQRPQSTVRFVSVPFTLRQRLAIAADNVSLFLLYAGLFLSLSLLLR